MDSSSYFDKIVCSYYKVCETEKQYLFHLNNIKYELNKKPNNKILHDNHNYILYLYTDIINIKNILLSKMRDNIII